MAPSTVSWLVSVLAKLRWIRERAFFGYVIDEMIPWMNPIGRALEVGCGKGLMLKALVRVGWRVEGVEWDTEAAKIARKVSGVPVIVGDFLELSLARSTFDLVVLHHVVEHLPDLNGALKRANEILGRRGRVVIVYPNPQSLASLVFYNHWFGWDPPRHLIMPTERALLDAAKRIGFTILSHRTTARYADSFVAHSRTIKAGFRVNLYGTSVKAYDRLFAIIESALVTLRLPVGEELVVVLEKKA